MYRQEIELLRILQTILLLLTSTKLLHGDTLAQAIVICFQLHAHNDQTIANTAAATLRQLVSVVFDRVIQEGIRQSECTLFSTTNKYPHALTYHNCFKNF